MAATSPSREPADLPPSPMSTMRVLTCPDRAGANPKQAARGRCFAEGLLAPGRRRPPVSTPGNLVRAAVGAPARAESCCGECDWKQHARVSSESAGYERRVPGPAPPVV